MNGARARELAGKTRTCPHCKATILESAAICPACQHHLRFDKGAEERARPDSVPLRVEGTIRQPAAGPVAEYSVVVSIRNEQGQEIARKVVGVGALQPSEARSFSLSVEVFKVNGLAVR
jgi:hypothetical protein